MIPNKILYEPGTVLYLTDEARKEPGNRWFAFTPFVVRDYYDHVIRVEEEDEEKRTHGHENYEWWRKEYLYAFKNAGVTLYGSEVTRAVPALLTPDGHDPSAYRLSWLASLMNLGTDGGHIHHDIVGREEGSGWMYTKARQWTVKSYQKKDGEWAEASLTVTVPEEVHFISVGVLLAASRLLLERKEKIEQQQSEFLTPNWALPPSEKRDELGHFEAQHCAQIEAFFGEWLPVLLHGEDDLDTKSVQIKE